MGLADKTRIPIGGWTILDRVIARQGDERRLEVLRRDLEIASSGVGEQVARDGIGVRALHEDRVAAALDVRDAA